MSVIHGERIVEHLMTLGHIGYEEGKGTSRMAYSKVFVEGRDYVRQLMEDVGLETEIDPVGNLCGRLPGISSKKIAMGSHIDTVPNGGMYDGALGVISAVECIRALKEAGYQNYYTLEVISFNEEE